MQRDCALAAFLKRTSVKRGLTSTCGTVGMNRRYSYSLTKPGVNPGRRKQLCLVESRVLTRFTPGYAGATLNLIRQVIGSKLPFRHSSCSANWTKLFLCRQAPRESTRH